jgi:hypothetical protein
MVGPDDRAAGAWCRRAARLYDERPAAVEHLPSEPLTAAMGRKVGSSRHQPNRTTLHSRARRRRDGADERCREWKTSLVSCDPKVIFEAARRGVVLPLADRSQPPRPFIVPKVAPPPERLKLVRRPNGRIVEPRQMLTKRLIVSGAVDPYPIIHTARRYREELPS